MAAPKLWGRIEQALLRRGINTILELGLWIALFYTVIGVGYAVFHVELMGQLQSSLNGTFTIFSDIAALITTVLGWPFFWGTSLVCGVAGCGLF